MFRCKFELIKCGSHQLIHLKDYDQLEKDFSLYEKKLIDVGGFYDKLGILLNFEVKNGINDYESIRYEISRTIKH